MIDLSIGEVDRSTLMMLSIRHQGISTRDSDEQKMDMYVGTESETTPNNYDDDFCSG